jgi:hypothetical protein
MLDTVPANMEISKRRSWESSKTVLSSQPEENEPDERTEDNDVSKYASVWQSNSGLNQSERRAGEPAVAAPKGQEKVKEGSRLIRKLKQFRKGTLFLFVHTVHTETLYRIYLNARRGFFLKFGAKICEVILTLCMNCRTRPCQIGWL